MLERYHKTSPDSFAIHELLEILLFYSIHRKNTNDTAHALLERFGSLKKLLSASKKDIVKVEGVGPRTADLIRLVSEINTRSETDKYKSVPLNSIFRQGSYIHNWFKGKNSGTVAIVLLDRELYHIETVILSEGKRKRSSVYEKAALGAAKKYEASYAILCHNHNDSCRVPSLNDMGLTASVRITLTLNGVFLLNHFIVTEDDCIPMQTTDNYIEFFLTKERHNHNYERTYSLS